MKNRGIAAKKAFIKAVQEIREESAKNPAIPASSVATHSEVKAAPSFTPGPWEYNDSEKFRQGYGTFSETAVYAPGNAHPWRMAEVQGPDIDTEIATARLIAAAPALYEACQSALLAIESATFNPLDASGDHAKRLVVRAMALVNG